MHFRNREQKTPGEILRWFSEKFYLIHLYNNNKLTYEELKTPLILGDVRASNPPIMDDGHSKKAG